MDTLRMYGLEYLDINNDIFVLQRRNNLDNIKIEGKINKIVYGKQKKYEIKENTLYFCNDEYIYEEDRKYGLKKFHIGEDSNIVYIIDKEKQNGRYSVYCDLFNLKYTGENKIDRAVEFVDNAGKKIKIYIFDMSLNKIKLIVNEDMEMMMFSLSDNRIGSVYFIFSKKENSDLNRIIGDSFESFNFTRNMLYMNNENNYILYHSYNFYSDFIRYLNKETNNYYFETLLSYLGNMKNNIMFVVSSSVNHQINYDNIVNSSKYLRLGSFITPVNSIDEIKKFYDENGYDLLEEKTNDNIYISERYKDSYSIMTAVKKRPIHERKHGRI